MVSGSFCGSLADRLLAMAGNLKVRVMLALGYGCGLRAGEIVRLKVGDIDSAQMIIRVVQSKGRKDRHVMLPQEVLSLLRQWWKVRPTRYDADVPARSSRPQAHGPLHPRCGASVRGALALAFAPCTHPCLLTSSGTCKLGRGPH